MPLLVGGQTTLFSETYNGAVLSVESAALTSGDFAVFWYDGSLNVTQSDIVEAPAGIQVVDSNTLISPADASGVGITGLSDGDLACVQASFASANGNAAGFEILFPPYYTGTSGAVPGIAHTYNIYGVSVSPFNTENQLGAELTTDFNGVAIAYYEGSTAGTAVDVTFVDGNALQSGLIAETTVSLAQGLSSVSVANPTQIVELANLPPTTIVVEWGSGSTVELTPITFAGIGASPVVGTTVAIGGVTGSVSLAPTSNGDLAIAFSNNGQILFDIDTSSLTTIAGDGDIVSPSSETHDYDPQVAQLTNGDFVVTWYNAAAQEIEARILDSSGQNIGGAFTVNTTPLSSNGASSLSVAALADGNFVINWVDIPSMIGGQQTVEQQIFSLAPTATFPFVNAYDILEAIYVGYYGRAADPGGDAWWLNELNAGNVSVSGMAAYFSEQTEAYALYPFLENPLAATQAQITSFITSIYENLFDRAPDSGGLSWWDNYLTQNLGNPQAVGTFILSVIGGAQNTSAGQDQTTIANKVTVAEFFTYELASNGISFTSSADTLAHTAIASVTSNPSSVSAAESTISNWLATDPIPLVGTSTTSELSSIVHI